MSRATQLAGYRSDLAASEVSFWVNAAYQDFVRDVPELLQERTQSYSLSSGDSLLQLPADFQEPISLSAVSTEEGSSYSLQPASPDWCDARGYYPTGAPERYFLYADEIQLWPSASSSADTTDASSGRSFLLRYRSSAVDLVSTSSVPSVATEHRIGIVYKATAHILRSLGNRSEANEAENDYLSFVLTLKDAFAKRQRAAGNASFSVPAGYHRRSALTDRKSDHWLKR
jgi:hypothetical protein